MFILALVSIYLKFLPPKYHLKKSKTHHRGSKKHFFLCLQAVDGITTFIWKNWRQNILSRHYLDNFKLNMAIFCLDNVQTTFFLLFEKIYGKKSISIKNIYFRASYMHYEARFLNLRVFLSFPQSNFMFTASILTCATVFFARFRFF